jgi:hypothetical protein
MRGAREHVPPQGRPAARQGLCQQFTSRQRRSIFLGLNALWDIIGFDEGYTR